MRTPSHVLKSLEEQSRKNKGYIHERLYRNLYNPEFYYAAYSNIARNQGSMTQGADGLTLDDMTDARINRIIASLKDHSYKPNPARRTYIAKHNNPAKKRPLGIPSTDDKLVQEVVRMILSAIYEPTFSNDSHGFRPGRSCHTALQSVEHMFLGIKWVIEGDIKACFDSFDHHVLINILRRRIHDERFIDLMWKMLRAGYMEQWIYRDTFSGTPQGSGVSPILANIYLSELDTFIEKYKADFEVRPKYRKCSHEYESARYHYRKSKKRLKVGGGRKTAVTQFKQAQNTLLKTPLYPAIDPSFKTIQYNRYADDFVVGIIGSKADAERVKQDIKIFLRDTLKLTLSEEKTHVTHSGDLIRYLGYDFTISRDKNVKRVKRNNDTSLQRCWYGRVRLYIPHEKWFGKLRQYGALKIMKDREGKEHWNGMHRGFLINRSDVDIISRFNSEIRGMYNFYRLADNASVLNKFYFIMEMSMLKTLAAKFDSSVKKMITKYSRDGVIGADYLTKAGMKRCEFYHDGFQKKEEALFGDIDVLPEYRRYDKPNSLAARLKAGVCEACGTKTGEIHMHHVKRLKDLTGKTEFESLMMIKRRKSLALCPTCFNATRDKSSKR
jgi:group II intron reverse transcriptase/maturase